MESAVRHEWWRFTLRLVLLAGLVSGCVWLLFLLREMARLSSCRPNLILHVSELYAKDNQGIFPPISPQPGRLMYDTVACGPYCYSVADHICEFDRQGPGESDLMRRSDPSEIDDWSYIYLGYAIENEVQLRIFAEKYMDAIEHCKRLEADLDVQPGAGTCGSDFLYRLRDREQAIKDIPGVEAAMSRIPVVIEWPENHLGPFGSLQAKVVFWDGHVEVMKYLGVFPMSEEAVLLFRMLDAVESPGV